MNTPAAKKGFSGIQVLGFVVGAMLLTIVVTVLALKTWLFPQPFTPVVLDQQEEQRLEHKIERFESVAALPGRQKQVKHPAAPGKNDFNSKGKLRPEAYSEQDSSREILLSEREINAMLAKNTDLAQKAAIDLSDDLISLRLLLPIDTDFPFMGGKTVRARAGAELASREGRPVVIVKGVSLMGVPIPNAWLGGIKNIDLVQEFGDQGFWQRFGEGVETIQVKKGQLYVKLKE